MTSRARAFYAREGSLRDDLVTILHVPYTAWHLSYVVMGAALAPRLDWMRLTGTLIAFFAGTGIAAHALDEWNGRPLRTKVSNRTLLMMAAGGIALSVVTTIVGTWLISAWVTVWAVVGFLLAAAYALEWWGGLLHTEFGFGIAWGAFPVLVAFWAQTETISFAAMGLAVAATIFSLTQRTLSTSARFVRRHTEDATARFRVEDGYHQWKRDELLSTWETPLRLLTVGMVVLALSLLLIRL